MQINVGIKKKAFIFAAPNEGKVHRESETEMSDLSDNVPDEVE